jgi:hypothetical protein
MALAHLTNIGETARGRLLSQYAGATKFIADIAVVVAEAQELEDAFWAFLEELDLDAASGVWLDVIGGLIGEHRDGAEDDPYRLLIAARILANKSAGSTDEHRAVGRLVARLGVSRLLVVGDLVAFWTDGVTERRHSGDMFGEQRLLSLLAGAANRPAGDVAREIDEAVMEFAPGLPHDDVAIMVARVTAVVGERAGLLGRPQTLQST